MQKFSLRKLLICYAIAFAPVTIGIGLLAVFNISPMYFVDQPYFGIKGFLAALPIEPIFTILFTLSNYILLNF
jgi:hypothetical protein